jgi:hypothetical protein
VSCKELSSGFRLAAVWIVGCSNIARFRELVLSLGSTPAPELRPPSLVLRHSKF